MPYTVRRGRPKQPQAPRLAFEQLQEKACRVKADARQCKEGRPICQNGRSQEKGRVIPAPMLRRRKPRFWMACVPSEVMDGRHLVACNFGSTKATLRPLPFKRGG